MTMDGPPQDDFKWFGEGFNGFPKRLPEDCVEYVVYIVDSELNSETQVRSRLKEFQNAAIALSKRLLKDYIWQRESFALEVQREDAIPVLRGRTNFGDSVADEWLIVYLLRELSKKFSDTWIRVYDTDGEFLLIEAANALPRWLNPEIAENRVWLHSGHLRIIPLQQPSTPAAKTAPVSRSLSIKEAISFISSSSSNLIHSPLIEEEAFYRLNDYPAQICETFHSALITIPRKLAFMLHANPAYISAAVEAFYLRDPIALRPLQSNKPEDLKFPPTDLVTTSVKFTKVGYAQLKSQRFEPPAVWTDSISKGAIEKVLNRAEIGMKVSCGFEMLVADPHNQDKRAVREIKLLLEDVESGEEKLHSDDEISKWTQKEDDESWLDIDFADFENELAGKKGGDASRSAASFGDKAAQQNLRKMVERFESFLNDDAAGAEGVEDLDEMDYDDEEDKEDDNSDASTESEDRDVSFDEAEFAKMMREMMGMPPEEINDAGAAATGKSLARVEEVNSIDEEVDEGDEIRKVMQRMEDELNEAGALNLDSTPRKVAAVKGIAPQEKKVTDLDSEDESDNEDEDVDIDLSLAKNLLESLKGQAGMAGPAGNMLSAMGLRFPRDEGEGDT
ncbi:SGT1 protein-domain-containing protein [Cryomyces antarcticus]